MNNKDVVKQLAEKTGLGEELCQKALNSFEKQAEIVLEDKIMGKKWNKEEIATAIAEKAGITLDESAKFMQALNDVLDKGLSEKLGFFE